MPYMTIKTSIMKHITALILFCTYCYSQDSIDVYENLNKQQSALSQSGYNEDRIKEFNEKSPFSTETSPYQSGLPKVEQYDKDAEGYVPSENPFMDSREMWNLVTPTNQAQQMRENDVELQEGEDNAVLINAYKHHDKTNWVEIGIISSVIVFMILAGLFIYKLLK